MAGIGQRLHYKFILILIFLVLFIYGVYDRAHFRTTSPAVSKVAITPALSFTTSTPPPVVPTISPEDIRSAINSVREIAGVSALKKHDDLCILAKDILGRLKSDWNTDTFDNLTKDFYIRHPGYMNLAMQADNQKLDTAAKVTAWLNNPDIKKDVGQPDYNAVCVVTDSGLTVQILGNYHLQPVLPRPSPVPEPTGPWGISRQVDEHTWTIKVGQDSLMATPSEIFGALNIYRLRYGASALMWDNNLASFAQSRAAYLNSIKNTDDHKGFNDYLNNQDGFNKLGFTSVGENMFYGYRLSGVHIIEWLFAGDKPHNDNQLDTRWNYVGIGVDGLGCSIIFGTGKR